MADDVYTTLLEFVGDESEASRSIKRLTSEIKAMEEEMAGLTKSADPKDLDRYAELRNKIALERTKVHQLELTQTREQEKAERSLISLSGERSRKQFEQIKANSILLAEFNKRIQGKSILDVSGIQSDIIANAPKIIKAAEDARKSELRETIRAQQIKIALYNREANVIRKVASDIRENAQILRNQADQLQSISQVGLGVGTGIVGGIFAFANKYVRDAKEATTVTVAWKEAQESLGESGQKVGAVLAQEALPLLQEAAEVAAKAAAFVEKHPEIVQAALNAGLVIAGLGAVGLAVSKGIRLYADQLYLSSIPLQLQAGQLQFAAAKEQLIAARVRAGEKYSDIKIDTTPGPTPKVPGAGNVLGTIGKVTLIASSVLIGAELGLALGNAIAKLLDPNAKDMNFQETLFYGGIRAVEALEQKFNNTLIELGEKIPDFLGGNAIEALGKVNNQKLQQVDKFFKELLLGADELGKAAEKLKGVRGSEAFEQVLKAYEDYRRDDLLLVRKHYQEREKVVQDSLQQQQQANAEYSRNLTRINTQTSKAIIDATRSYEEQERESEIQNAQERARIIRDSGIEIQRIEENLQENLRKIRQDHEDRLEDLVASRDALGIVKEQRRYARERAEEIRQTNIEIRQRRADLAIRLQDLQQNFVQERAQRFADFQARLEEIKINAAEQRKELAAQHQDELNQIRLQRVQRLQELDAQLKEERQRRYDYFISQVRDLDAALLGEADLRKRRQDEMIAELDAFLLRYNAGLRQLQTVPSPGRAAGGYATYGTYLLGDKIGGGRGKPEYVLDGDITELAERVLGGRISRNKIATLLNAFGGGSRRNVTYNDNRRISGPVTGADRNRIMDGTMEAVNVILEGI